MKNEEIKINPPKKMGFFKRIQTAIFKVENYGEFILEKTGVAIGYFFKLMLLATFIIALAITISTHKMVVKGFNYLQNEMPNFTLEEGVINFEEDTIAYDKDMDFYVVYSTKKDLSDTEIEDIEKEVKKYSMALIYLKDKVVLYQGESFSAFKYIDLLTEYKLNVTSKDDVLKMANNVGVFGIDVTYFASSFVSTYIYSVINTITDVVLVFCFGILVARICGVSIPILKTLSISIYSLTLSILLSVVYTIAYNFTNFYVEYFDIVYLLIAYIYLIASILIIKSDIIKQKIELQKIIEVQKQVKEELEEQKEEEKEDNKKDDKEDKENDEEDDENSIPNREPDGSEI